jgi:hypothetical protein
VRPVTFNERRPEWCCSSLLDITALPWFRQPSVDDPSKPELLSKFAALPPELETPPVLAVPPVDATPPVELVPPVELAPPV